MRVVLTTAFIALLSVDSVAQSAPPRQTSTVYSASSGWQKVTFRKTARLPSNQSARGAVAPARQPAAPPTDRIEPVTGANPTEGTPAGSAAAPSAGYRPAFTGDFVTNRNRWKAGSQGDYQYQIGLGAYSIRKQNTRTQRAAFSSVPLPAAINLNSAEAFTIKVDVLADSGQVPTAGLLFGVKDSLNFCSFTLNARGEVSIRREANGQTFSDYMPGDFFMPGVPVEKNRNRLTIRRRGEYLHFFVNDREIRSSPYLFRLLSGNGIGLTSSGYWTSFQKLSVTVGL